MQSMQAPAISRIQEIESVLYQQVRDQPPFDPTSLIHDPLIHLASEKSHPTTVGPRSERSHPEIPTTPAAHAIKGGKGSDLKCRWPQRRYREASSELFESKQISAK